ncbi:MAG: epoxide hydrolase [Acidimicrobiales bacterium]
MLAQMEPYTVGPARAEIADLRQRLAAARWPSVVAAGWDEGIDVAYLRGLCDYWSHGYEWAASADRLNHYPQFVTRFEDEQIHFIHVPSPHAGAMPLLLLHGWPSSVFEFAGLIDTLTRPESHGGTAADAYHVVIPSLPGFGFSGPISTPGWTPRQIARAMVALMHRLDYPDYGVHGGHWGSFVAAQMGSLVPDRVVGIHMTTVAVERPPRAEAAGGVTSTELEDLESGRRRNRLDRGVREIQAVRPQTISLALNDSPVGLAAWILDRFRAWSDCGDDLDNAFDRGDLLDDITTWWVTGTIASANRLHLEARRAQRGEVMPSERVRVPMGHARFPGEVIRPPRAWVERLFDVRWWTRMPAGGRFASLEQPDLLVADLRGFFASVR